MAIPSFSDNQLMEISKILGDTTSGFSGKGAGRRSLLLWVSRPRRDHEAGPTLLWPAAGTSERRIRHEGLSSSRATGVR